MTDRAPDDIFALFSRFDLDGDDYRVFTRLGSETSQSAATENLLEPVEALPETTGAEWAINAAEETGGGSEGAGMAPIPLQANAPGDRLGLQNLFRHVGARRANARATPDSLACRSVSIHGSAGGVGVTTIAAVLARFLARSNRRCAILENGEESILPVLFGTQRIVEGHRRFSGIHSVFEPKIRILKSCRSHDPVEYVFAETGGDFDHLLLDNPHHSVEPIQAAINLCVAVPDVSSLLGARRLRAAVEGTDFDQTICVLNRFNPQSVMHEEIFGWYAETFREVVTIIDSPLVSEALAEGTTVVDWTPESDVSADFGRLSKAGARLVTDAVAVTGKLTAEIDCGSAALTVKTACRQIVGAPIDVRRDLEGPASTQGWDVEIIRAVLLPCTQIGDLDLPARIGIESGRSPVTAKDDFAVSDANKIEGSAWSEAGVNQKGEFGGFGQVTDLIDLDVRSHCGE